MKIYQFIGLNYKVYVYFRFRTLSAISFNLLYLFSKSVRSPFCWSGSCANRKRFNVLNTAVHFSLTRHVLNIHISVTRETICQTDGVVPPSCNTPHRQTISWYLLGGKKSTRDDTLGAQESVLDSKDCTRSLDIFLDADFYGLPDFPDVTYLHGHQDEKRKKKQRLTAFTCNMRGLQRTRVQQTTLRACI